jgi:hypothetical protein
MCSDTGTELQAVECGVNTGMIVTLPASFCQPVSCTGGLNLTCGQQCEEYTAGHYMEINSHFVVTMG